MKTAFIICARLASSRVPNKAIAKINGKTMLDHLTERLGKTGIQIIVAVPPADSSTFVCEVQNTGVNWYIGETDDPLRRTYLAAEAFGIDNVIRVCHDKIFVDPEQVFAMLDVFNRRALDYCYSSKFVDGTAFEIISRQALRLAAEKYRNVEFIGYAVKSVTDNTLDYDLPTRKTDARLLLDYPEDKILLEAIMQGCGNACGLEEALGFLEKNRWAKRINQLPKVTVYTAAYNAEKFIEQCMGSVAKQRVFGDMEYILVDDHSSDKTTQLIAKFCAQFKNARWFRNEKNLGLASSSNIALALARSRYILRLDADDYLHTNHAVSDLVEEIEATGKDVIIPNNWFGSMDKVQHGKDVMHIGGSLFRTRAVNHIKFTDGLRGLEGLDFFTRARDQLSIGYLNKPTFFYRQRPDSMSKTNLDDRTRIKQSILNKASEFSPV